MGRRSFLVALGVASTRGDQITRSMIAAYTFDDLTAADSGPNGWHGTAANYVPVVTERGDYAMSFGGNWDDDGGVIDDDIVFPAAVTAALGGSADRSFCLFAEVDQFDDGVMFYYGAAETDREFGLRTENAGAPAYVTAASTRPRCSPRSRSASSRASRSGAASRPSPATGPCPTTASCRRLTRPFKPRAAACGAAGAAARRRPRPRGAPRGAARRRRRAARVRRAAAARRRR